MTYTRLALDMVARWDKPAPHKVPPGQTMVPKHRSCGPNCGRWLT